MDIEVLENKISLVYNSITMKDVERLLLRLSHVACLLSHPVILLNQMICLFIEVNGYLYELHNIAQLKEFLANCIQRKHQWNSSSIAFSLNKFSKEEYISIELIKYRKSIPRK